jgi:hypothetical protein
MNRMERAIARVTEIADWKNDTVDKFYGLRNIAWAANKRSKNTSSDAKVIYAYLLMAESKSNDSAYAMSVGMATKLIK